MTQASVVRQLAARSFLEGPEHCREYLRNGQLWFGTSMLQPGQTGATDPGHPASWEVFYCASGHAVVDDCQTCQELLAGDALLIPPAVPHTITNVGTDTLVVVWAGAPGEQPKPDDEQGDLDA